MISLKNGHKASKVAIAAVELALGCELSPSFKAFVENNDGAEPETNSFKIGDQNDSSGVRAFVPVDQILKERVYLREHPPHAYPIAFDDCGNYVVIDEGERGAIYFWDHELYEPLTRLADGFDEFLALVEPFDISKIQLKPGQAKRVWTHPDFEKLVKKFEDK